MRAQLAEAVKEKEAIARELVQAKAAQGMGQSFLKLKDSINKSKDNQIQKLKEEVEELKKVLRDKQQNDKNAANKNKND